MAEENESNNNGSASRRSNMESQCIEVEVSTKPGVGSSNSFSANHRYI